MKELRYCTLEEFKKFEDEMTKKLEEIYACLWEQVKFNKQQLELNDLHQEYHQGHCLENRQDHKK